MEKDQLLGHYMNSLQLFLALSIKIQIKDFIKWASL